MELNNLVKEEALKVDIDLCRITDGKELKKEREILVKRQKGRYWPQAFTNQNIEELTKPKLHFPNLKSVIVAAISYNNNAGNQFLSNYVTVSDYHLFLKNKLEQLVNSLENKIEQKFNYKIFVDTAPFLERALAQRAGIGFIGKNTMLINPEYGSYLFLGEIFTDIKIETDEELELDCGNCSICLDNCEGKALKNEYILDAKNCISYLSQKKGILSEKENQKLDAHIWGCDACQLKCPYNKNKSLTSKKEMQFFNKDLEYFLNLNRKQLPPELKNTAITWRGGRILIRNALIAAANLGQEKYFEAVKKNLNDNSPIIRYYTVYSLAKINFKRALPIIVKRLKMEKNKFYKEKMEEILEMRRNLNGD